KLYSDALLSRLEEQETEDLRLLISRAIALLFNSPARPPENLAVFSSVLSNILGEADDLGSDGLMAQLLVARAHANLKQLITARRYYERIDDRLRDSLDGEL